MNKGVRTFFAAITGCFLGAVFGGLIAAVPGIAFLVITMKLSGATGDQATGAGGLILLFVAVGAIAGGCFGASWAVEHFVPPENK